VSGLESFVRFEAGGQLFALPLREVREVVPPAPLTPIPGGPRSALGVMNHHGRVITLMDLRTLLDGRAPLLPGICVLLDAPDRRIALGVTRVEGIGPLEVVDGMARAGDRAISVLEAGTLFAAVDLSFGQGAVLESRSIHREEP